MRSVYAAADGLNAARPGEADSDEAQIQAIHLQFRRKLQGLRRLVQAWEMPAILRALQTERDLSIWLLRERRAQERFSEREERRRLRMASKLQP